MTINFWLQSCYVYSTV